MSAVDAGGGASAPPVPDIFTLAVRAAVVLYQASHADTFKRTPPVEGFEDDITTLVTYHIPAAGPEGDWALCTTDEYHQLSVSYPATPHNQPRPYSAWALGRW